MLSGKSTLITDGTGSFGNCLVDYVFSLRSKEDHHLLRSEYEQLQMEKGQKQQGQAALFLEMCRMKCVCGEYQRMLTISCRGGTKA